MKSWLLFTFYVATLVCGGLCLVDAQGHARADAEKPHVYFVPIGDTPASVIDTLIVHCRGKLNLSADTLPRLGSDRLWLDPQRGQIVAERVIASLRQRYPRHARNDVVIIGIASADMYIARYPWQFAFGYRPGGGSGQRVAVVSTARMAPEFYHGRRNDSLFMERLRKMVVRYIGVLHFRLPFTADPKSVLYRDLLGLDELDTMGEELPVTPTRNQNFPTQLH